MKRFLPLLGMAAGAAAVAACRWMVRRPLPPTAAVLAVEGLEETAEVVRDPWGVPHCFAQSLGDAFFAQGYVTAQDRLFQMDLNRRASLGRLSEIFGPVTLAADQYIRRLGLRRPAEAEVALLEGEARTVMASYCAGINAYLAGCRALPVEYMILRARPEPWTVVDVLAWGKMTALGLATNWDSELSRLRLLREVGPEWLARLEPMLDDAAVPLGELVGLRAEVAEESRRAAHLFGFLGAASNAWAVAGSHTTTGKPLLASDPHLRAQMPCIFYEVHLRAPDFEVAGATIPGLPGVFIGHNRRIAWGVTAGMADNQDLYVQRRHPREPHRFEFQGGWEDAEVRREEIRVRGRPPVFEEVEFTRHGPVVAEMADGRPLALRSAVLEPQRLVAASLAYQRASTWEEFRAALEQFTTPCLNFIYADADGNVGHQFVGRVPIRTAGHGLAPVPGWTGEWEWKGYVPFEELPSHLNPTGGVVVNANDRPHSDNYPYFLGCEWAEPHRAQRIATLLGQREDFTIADFQAMQVDVLTGAGLNLARRLADALAASEDGGRGFASEAPLVRQAADALRAWDGRLTLESVGGAVYEVARRRLARLVFESRLHGATDVFLGAGVHPLIPSNSYSYRLTSLLERLVAEADPAWFTDRASDGVGTWEGALRRGLEEAVAFLRQRFGPDVSRWRWGDLHLATFVHPLGNVRLLAPLFNLGPFPLGGDTDTVMQTGVDPAGSFFASGWLPNYRMVVDLADFNRSVAVLNSGQSGQLGSPHRRDQHALWRRGETHPMLWDETLVRRAAVGTIWLRPG